MTKTLNILTNCEFSVIYSEDGYIIQLIKNTVNQLSKNADVQYINTGDKDVAIIDSKRIDGVYMDIVVCGILCTAYAHGYKVTLNNSYFYTFSKCMQKYIGDQKRGRKHV